MTPNDSLKPTAEQLVKRLCDFCKRVGHIRAGCWACDRPKIKREMRSIELQGRKLLIRAAEIERLQAEKTKESRRADCWVEEARKLAKSLGVSVEDSNGSIDDWRTIRQACSELAALRQKVAELEAKVPRWIPVAERLPEDEAIVLVWIGEELATIKGQEVQIARAHLTKEDDKYAVAPVTFSFSRAGFLGGNEVTHWMPLPTTPQEDRS